ncbi:MAG: tetratricopeptide repeat protein [Kofleriaceae bacterium]
MIWAAIAAGIVALTLAGIVYLRAKRRDHGLHGPAVVAGELGPRIDACVRAFESAGAWRPATAEGAAASAAAIEAALIANDPDRALELAEAAVSAQPTDAGSRVWLAWVLCVAGEPATARAQLEVAIADLHGGFGPLGCYVAARAEHLAFEHRSGAVGSMPPLVTTADLAVVTIASGRGGSAWFPGATEIQLSSAEVRAAVAEHREVTGRCLNNALAALERAPGFSDALYLVARLAVKCGLVAEARRAFVAAEPRMIGRPDTRWFERDREDLADPARAVAAASKQPVAAAAKRSTRLRVLP